MFNGTLYKRAFLVHLKREDFAVFRQRLLADGAVEGEGHLMFWIRLIVRLPHLLHRVVDPVADGIGDDRAVVVLLIGHLIPGFPTAAAAGQREGVALQDILTLSLIDRRLHPAVFQLPALVVVFGHAFADGEPAQVLRRKAPILSTAAQGLGDVGILPGVIIRAALRPGLERQLHLHVRQLRLEGRRLPDLGGVHRHRAGELVGEGSFVVEVCIVFRSFRIGLAVGQLFQPAVAAQHPDGIRHIAVCIHSAQHLGVAAGVVAGEILPDHIDILVALRVVLGQVPEGDLLGVLLVERYRHDAAAVVPDGGGSGIALPGPVAPELQLTVRPVTGVRLVLPDLGGGVVLGAREGQVQDAAVVDLVHLRAHVGRPGVVIGDLEPVPRIQHIVLDPVIRVQPAVAVRSLLHGVFDAAAVQVVLPQAGNGDGAAGIARVRSHIRIDIQHFTNGIQQIRSRGRIISRIH